MKELMPFEKFEKIMQELRLLVDKKERISKFVEQEVCEDSFIVITLGNNVFELAVNMLADEFDCWFDWPGIESEGNWWDNDNKRFRRDNDINYFIYEADWGRNPLTTITAEGKKFYLSSTRDLYDYLVYNYGRKYIDNAE